MAELRRCALDELPPCRRVEEEVADFDRRADVAGRRLWIADHPAAVDDLICGISIARAREDAGMRNRANARQRFTAEAHRRDAEEVLIVRELAGRMRRERQWQVARRDSSAIVDDADQLA